MTIIDSKTVLQTVPLLGGCILTFLYLRRCKNEKRKVEYETIFLIFTNSIALTSAALLIAAAYVAPLRGLIPELGVFIAISGIVLAHMAWQSTKQRVFFKEHGKLTEEQDEIDRIVSEHGIHHRPMSQNAHKDLLILVDIQKDFFKDGELETPNTESLIDPLNHLLSCAESLGCKIVLSRDWHPEDHKSFEGHGGRWPQHCVRGTNGAEFHSRLNKTDEMEIVSIGVDNQAPDYSAFDDPRMEQIVSSTDIRTVYVAGIALEYCVLATCLNALEHGKTVIALEPYIRAATTDEERLEEHWRELTTRGVIRAKNIAGCTS